MECDLQYSARFISEAIRENNIRLSIVILYETNFQMCIMQPP